MKKAIRKKCRFPAARIKRIMQSDEDIGKISVTAPVVVGKATELFIEEITAAVIKGLTKKTKKVTTEDIKSCILEMDKYKFLKGALEEEE